ncbi:TetR/AcrR family transcriptional regulator [Pseudonocardia xishanensis]|uniref:HTH tetR-type domain-containing protein n=1 Tax=Pseudonocardia xishanensis TaxID=630995 RepID=A0ABP8RUM4_9PSEU
MTTTEHRRRIPDGPADARILHAARGLFAVRGYEAASLRSVATAAGCTLATIYHWFGGKEDVLAQIVQPFAENYVDRCRALAARPEPASERMRDLVRFSVEYRNAHPFDALVVDRERRTPSCVVGKLTAAPCAQTVEIWRAVAQDGIGSGEFAVDAPDHSLRAVRAVCRSVATAPTGTVDTAGNRAWGIARRILGTDVDEALPERQRQEDPLDRVHDHRRGHRRFRQLVPRRAPHRRTTRRRPSPPRRRCRRARPRLPQATGEGFAVVHVHLGVGRGGPTPRPVASSRRDHRPTSSPPLTSAHNPRPPAT